MAYSRYYVATWSFPPHSLKVSQLHRETHTAYAVYCQVYEIEDVAVLLSQRFYVLVVSRDPGVRRFGRAVRRGALMFPRAYEHKQKRNIAVNVFVDSRP